MEVKLDVPSSDLELNSPGRHAFECYIRICWSAEQMGASSKFSSSESRHFLRGISRPFRLMPPGAATTWLAGWLAGWHALPMLAPHHHLTSQRPQAGSATPHSCTPAALPQPWPLEAFTRTLVPPKTAAAQWLGPPGLVDEAPTAAGPSCCRHDLLSTSGTRQGQLRCPCLGHCTSSTEYILITCNCGARPVAGTGGTTSDAPALAKRACRRFSEPRACHLHHRRPPPAAVAPV